MLRPTLVIALLLVSGCAGPKDPAPPGPLLQEPEPPRSQVVATPAGPSASPDGLLDGTVRDAKGGAVAGAQVELVGVGLQAVTDNRGEFVLDGLAPGTFVVRVQREGFLPAASPVAIAAGERIHLDVVMVADAAPPTLVDFWHGRDRVLVMDGEFSGQDNPLADTCLAAGGASGGGHVRWDGPPVLRFDDPHQLVWPGTASIEVELDWSEQSYSGDEMLVAWRPHPDGAWGWSGLTPKGQTIRFEVAPQDADGPYQRFTAWEFAVCTKDQSGAPDQQWKNFRGAVHARMTLVRGHPLPLRTPEADLWGNATRLVLVNATKHFTASDPLTDFYFALGPCNGAFTRLTRLPAVHEQADLQQYLDHNWEFPLFEGLLVPNGTARIVASLQWEYGTVATQTSDLFLSFRAADVAPWEPADPSLEHVPEASSAGPGRRDYSFTVDPMLLDGADDVRTAWRFYWNVDGPAMACNTLDVTLHVEAFRDV